MSNVTLLIGGREHTVACADGEEAHIARLGRLIDGKLASMGNAGSQSETRSLLFAALLLADELHELKSRPESAPPAPAPPEPAPSQPSIAPERLEAIATRLENLASHLES